MMRKSVCVGFWATLILLAVSWVGPVADATQFDLTYYVGVDLHVHELRFNGTSWTTADLMAATGAPNAAGASALTGHVYGTSDNVWYIATDQHVHGLAYYGSPAAWHTADVTALAGAPNAAAGSPLTSHLYGSSDNIYYVATDGDIHELAFYGSPATWHTANATALSGAPIPASNSPLTSVAFTVDNSESEFFISGDEHVRQIKFNGAWQTTDLTYTQGAPNATYGSSLTSHIYGNSESVWYIGSDQHVHEFAYYSSAWHTSDVTALAGAPDPVSGSALAGNQNGSQDDVYFINPSSHLHLLWFDGVHTWHSVDVSGLGGGPDPADQGALASHVYGSAENTYYFAGDQHVHELSFYNNSWHASDLTALAHAPNAVVGASDLISFLGL